MFLSNLFQFYKLISLFWYHEKIFLSSLGVFLVFLKT